ncbi:MAG: alanine dehydrogenase [Spirochaetales bacterium]|nr:alanine dehydrogenase [Spirochaetales bacterium]
MVIGIPKEIKTAENRVGLTPAGVHEFVKSGHTVLVEKKAGEGSGFSDTEFKNEGAKILKTPEEIFNASEMIIKVKEPLEREIPLLKEGQILYTYLHLAASKDLTVKLLERKIIGIAYETIEVKGKLVCLEPMSEVAGKIATIMGAYYLAKPYGGKGILAGGVAGVHSANYIILGGGTTGINAAKVAAGLGARVVVMDIDLERMRYLEDVLPKNCETIMSNRINIEKELPDADVVIGAVLIPGGRTPCLITRKMLSIMKPGSVIVDIAIDQGGCAETSHPTTHEEPVYAVDGIVHYCVANMPGAYPRSSTFALTNATLPFGLKIAALGWKKAASESAAITKGVNLSGGKLTCEPVAMAHGLKYSKIE